ncbi:MAG: DUF1385 domain-containing protein [Deltaproteobacteria bacterium]|nr:DUF1385 domain-containing protein [Deltaproteobacteria bacterium]
MAEGPMSVGGQAILEGVMMRSPHSLAVAVRRPNGEIVVKEDRWVSIWERARFLRKPLLRGAVVLFESLHNGMKALTFSAEEAGRGLDAESPDAKDQAPLSDMALFGTILLSLAFGFALFAALPHFLTWLAGTVLGNASLASGKDLGFQIVDGILKIGVLVGYLALISRMPDIQRVFQYHGAEHKSIYCYEDGKALTVDNARSYTTLHPRCGTSFLLITVVVSILLFSAVFPLLPTLSETKWLNQLAYVFIKVPLMFPVAGIAYEMTRLSARHPGNPIVRVFTWPGLQLQHITTREPDDTQLEIALVALQMTLRREMALQAGVALQAQQEPVVFASYPAFVAATEPPVHGIALAA